MGVFDKWKKTKDPELLDDDDEQYADASRDLEPYTPGVPVARRESGPSNLPLGNYINRKRVEGYRKLVEEQGRLCDSLAERDLKFGRLLDLEVEIETDRVERRNQLRDAQRRAGLADKQDRLAHVDLDVKIAEAEKRQRELSSPSPPVDEFTKAEDDYARQRAKKLLQQEQDDQTERDKMRANFRSQEVRVEEYEREMQRRINRIRRGRPFSELTEEELQKIDLIEADFEDLIQSSHDRSKSKGR